MSDSVDEPGRRACSRSPERVVGGRLPMPTGFWASASTAFPSAPYVGHAWSSFESASPDAVNPDSPSEAR